MRPSLLGTGVFAVLMILTVVLSVTAVAVADSTERRLLRLQARQTATVVLSSVQDLATPLASAAEVAAGTGGDSASFRQYVAGFLAAESRFTSLTLWSVTGADVQLVSTIGRPPGLGTSSATTAFVRRAATAGAVAVNGLLGGPSPLVGYGYGSSRGTTRYVVYVESALTGRHRVVAGTDSPFHDLHFALYLGSRASARDLLLTSEAGSTLSGRTATTTLRVGTAVLTLVVAPRGALGGRSADARWWIVLVLGGAVAVGAGLLTDRLVKRRRRAEALTAEIDVLLRDQKGIAETLQRALVPGGLPPTDGLEMAARYLPGVNGVEIGGDWFDVVPVDDAHVFFALGDVSGRGIEAGSVMAALHFAIRAYASEGHDPATVLNLLGSLIALPRDEHFATVVCGLVDLDTATVTVANAGHLPMLVVHGAQTHFVQAPIGPPVGVIRGARYRSTTVELPTGATLLAYTDGLIERRGEGLDDGLARLREAVSDVDASVEALVHDVLTTLTPDGSDDDIAVLALRPTRRLEQPGFDDHVVTAPAHVPPTASAAVIG